MFPIPFGVPDNIVSDLGTHLTSQSMQSWALKTFTGTFSSLMAPACRPHKTPSRLLRRIQIQFH